jgi:large subunit ribosomal protein L13
VQKTYVTKEDDIQRDWLVVDAAGQTLGRLASEVARLLRGKHKPSYSPSTDVGDYVVVINAEKVEVTGRKLDQKTYYRHSGYPGGLKAITLRELLRRRPTRVIKYAVRGMLPRNRLGRRVFKEHPHAAQNPRALDLG